MHKQLETHFHDAAEALKLAFDAHSAQETPSAELYGQINEYAGKYFRSFDEDVWSLRELHLARVVLVACSFRHPGRCAAARPVDVAKGRGREGPAALRRVLDREEGQVGHVLEIHVLASPRESAHAKEHQAVSLAIERFHGVSTPAVEKAQSLACLQSRG